MKHCTVCGHVNFLHSNQIRNGWVCGLCLTSFSHEDYLSLPEEIVDPKWILAHQSSSHPALQHIYEVFYCSNLEWVDDYKSDNIWLFRSYEDAQFRLLRLVEPDTIDEIRRNGLKTFDADKLYIRKVPSQGRRMATELRTIIAI